MSYAFFNNIRIPLDPRDLKLTWNPPGWGSATIPPEMIQPFFAPKIRLAMVVGVNPGGYIPFHKDAPASENGLEGTKLERFHIVILTNERCWCFHDGTWQQLKEGGMYKMDPTKEHASINLGDTTRYHLVVDWEMK